MLQKKIVFLPHHRSDKIIQPYPSVSWFSHCDVDHCISIAYYRFLHSITRHNMSSIAYFLVSTYNPLLRRTGFPFLYQVTSGGGIPLVKHLNVALSPSLTVSLFMGLSNTGATRGKKWFWQWVSEHYLVLINQVGGLYGRILTKVASTDRTQWGLYQRLRSRFSHTDRPSSVNKMFIIWPNKNNLISLM